MSSLSSTFLISRVASVPKYPILRKEIISSTWSFVQSKFAEITFIVENFSQSHEDFFGIIFAGGFKFFLCQWLYCKFRLFSRFSVNFYHYFLRKVNSRWQSAVDIFQCGISFLPFNSLFFSRIGFFHQTFIFIKLFLSPNSIAKSGGKGCQVTCAWSRQILIATCRTAKTATPDSP